MSRCFRNPTTPQEANPAAYNLCIFDGNMGGGAKDGLPSLERARAFFAARPNLREPPIVILSGEADPREQARYVERGAARVVLKPASQEALRGLRALACEHASSAATPAPGGRSPPVAPAPAASPQPRPGAPLQSRDGQAEGDLVLPPSGAAAAPADVSVEITQP